MKRKTILTLLSVSIIALTLNLTGCTNESRDLSQHMVVTDDVKSDTEPKLKVIDNETIYFEEPLIGYGYNFYLDVAMI